MASAGVEMMLTALLEPLRLLCFAGKLVLLIPSPRRTASNLVSTSSIRNWKAAVFVVPARVATTECRMR